MNQTITRVVLGLLGAFAIVGVRMLLLPDCGCTGPLGGEQECCPEETPEVDPTPLTQSLPVTQS